MEKKTLISRRRSFRTVKRTWPPKKYNIYNNISVERATYTLISSSIADLNNFFFNGSNLLGSKSRDLIFFKIVNYSWFSINIDGDALWKLY